MLTVAYCRVSTEEQAAEGFSIEGQAEKLRAYATLHDLGPRHGASTDPGRVGQEHRTARTATGAARWSSDGHVAHVLVWRLDRLSRNLGDLILLADEFGQANVGLHSFCERIDLSSATGRMFYNVLGAFAQFYREQLAENVRMGMAQGAARRASGSTDRRPATTSSTASSSRTPTRRRVRRIFRLRAEGASHRDIERGDRHQALAPCWTILRSRIYLGEVLLQRRVVPRPARADHHGGRVRGRAPGLPEGQAARQGPAVGSRALRPVPALDEHRPQRPGAHEYRCAHRGTGCRQPRRSLEGPASCGAPGASAGGDRRAAPRARFAGQLEAARAAGPPGRAPGAPGRRRRHFESSPNAGASSWSCTTRTRSAPTCSPRRKRRLTPADRTRPEHESERHERETQLIRRAHRAIRGRARDPRRSSTCDRVWEAATRAASAACSIDELLDGVTIFPDHLEVTVARGAEAECPAQRGRARRVAEQLVSEGGLEPPRLAGTSPSSWRVCRFRHSDVDERS